MKTYKKLLVGAVSMLVMGLFFVTAPKHAAATGTATLAQLINCNKTFQWQDYAHINCWLDANHEIVFTDSNPDYKDGGGHYVFAPPSGVFCGPDNTEKNSYGIGLEGLVVETAKNYNVLVFNEGYLQRGKSDCQSFWDGYLSSHGHDAADGYDNAFIGPSAHSLPRWPNRSAYLLAGTADGATSLPDVTDGPFAGYNFVRWKSDYDPKIKGAKVYLFAQGISLNQIGTDCAGSILAVTADGSDNSAGAREYTLGTTAGDVGGPISDYPDLNNLPKAPNCFVHDYNFASGDIDQSGEQFYLSPQIKKMGKIGEGDVTQGGPTGKTPTADNPSGTCEGSTGLLSWLTCPLLTTAQDAANFLYKEFEGLLSFNVNQDLGDSSSQASVKKTWSLIRNLATAFLVILMLIMVFSQAISAGPFDAYTVRKMLPRLIAVAIAIQLSWAIVSWVINIFNDLGNGIADIMYWPFGGAEKLTLWKLLDHAGVGGGTTQAIDYTAIGAGFVLGAAAFPTVLLMVLGAVVAIFTGYFTLIMRKIIIIVLLVFAPIAMLAYVLPNTQKYWKMWYDNLIKILFMFPLIMIMISSGRIFAFIGGGQGGAGGILNFILVMVAFFGPLFLLPKTYKWGGQAMSIASGAVGGITNRYAGRDSAAGKGLQGIGERWQGRRADKLDYSRTGKRAGFANAYRRVQSGHMIPFSERSKALALQAGGKWSDDERALAKLHVGNVYKKALANGYTDSTGKVHEKGVAAAKHAMADLSRDDNYRVGEEAIRQFVETASWPEAQSYVDSKGRRIFDDNKNWNAASAKNPDIYKPVLEKRADAASHIIERTDKAFGEDPYGKDEAAKEKEYAVKSAHRMNFAIDEQMNIEELARTADGFWQEGGERVEKGLASSDADEKAMAELLQYTTLKKFSAISQLPPTTKAQILGHFADGGPLQESVTKMLAGSGKTIQDFIDDKVTMADLGLDPDHAPGVTEVPKPGGKPGETQKVVNLGGKEVKL